jgi:transposase
MARYELTKFEWKVVQPLLPNMPCGLAVCRGSMIGGLNGIFWALRSGSPWPTFQSIMAYPNHDL